MLKLVILKNVFNFYKKIFTGSKKITLKYCILFITIIFINPLHKITQINSIIFSIENKLILQTSLTGSTNLIVLLSTLRHISWLQIFFLESNILIFLTISSNGVPSLLSISSSKRCCWIVIQQLNISSKHVSYNYNVEQKGNLSV